MRSIHPIAAAAVAAWLALAGAARAEEPAAPPAAPETAAPAPPETAEPAKAEAATPGKPHKRRRKPAEEPLPPPAPPAPVAAAAPPVPVPAPQPWSEGVMLRRLCGDGLRPNEEDRLFGMISLTVRSTIRYEGAKVSEELVGGAAEDAVSGLIAACPRLLAAAEPQRLGIAIEVIRDATRQRIAQGKEAPTRRLAARMPGRKTAADLSEALTPHEVDAWLDGLPPRQRALALFLYASDVTAKEEAEALGLPLAAQPPGHAELFPRRRGRRRDARPHPQGGAGRRGAKLLRRAARTGQGRGRGAAGGGPHHRDQPRPLCRLVAAGRGDRPAARANSRRCRAVRGRTRRRRQAPDRHRQRRDHQACGGGAAVSPQGLYDRRRHRGWAARDAAFRRRHGRQSRSAEDPRQPEPVECRDRALPVARLRQGRRPRAVPLSGGYGASR